MEVTRCTVCELRQVRTSQGCCRRCGAHLLTGAVSSCEVVIVYVRVSQKPSRSKLKPEGTLEQIVFRAVRKACDRTGAIGLAAEELGISRKSARLILHRGGDKQDWRKKGRA